MGYNGKRRPEEGHPCIGHRVQSERLWFRRDQVLLLQLLVAKFPFWRGCPAITPCSLLRAGKLRVRQTDVADLERSARLPTKKKWVRGVERRR